VPDLDSSLLDEMAEAFAIGFCRIDYLGNFSDGTPRNTRHGSDLVARSPFLSETRSTSIRYA